MKHLCSNCNKKFERNNKSNSKLCMDCWHLNHKPKKGSKRYV